MASHVSAHTERKVSRAIHAKQYKRAGRVIKKKINNIKQAQVLAKKVNNGPLSRAVKAASRFKAERKKHRLTLSTAKFLEMALFLETDLSRLNLHKEHYLAKKKTGFICDLEYLPFKKSAFIVLNSGRSTFLGKGRKKTVRKAILYNRAKPKVVARALQDDEMKTEVSVMRSLSRAKGVIEYKGSKKNKRQTVLYSELYPMGDLQTLFEKNKKFTLSEKIEIATSLMRGIKSMHSKKIVHRDITAKNVFLKRSEKGLQAVVADFGWARYCRHMRGKHAQANWKYNAPKSFHHHKLHRKSYYRQDIYATGLILYRLYYGKPAPWLFKKSKIGSPKRHSKWLSAKIHKKTKARKKQLAGMQNRGKSNVTHAFEQLILRMVHPKSNRRGTASQIYLKLQRLSKKAQKSL